MRVEWWHTGGPKGAETAYAEGKGAEIIEWRTVATDDDVIKKGKKNVIESIKDGTAEAVTDSMGVFKVTDTGGGVEGNHIDIFVGEMFHKDVNVMSSKIPDVFNKPTRVGVIKQ
jgi:3D (Asp-Asp-Asp) domain-containing protein